MAASLLVDGRYLKAIIDALDAKIELIIDVFHCVHWHILATDKCVMLGSQAQPHVQIRDVSLVGALLFWWVNWAGRRMMG